MTPRHPLTVAMQLRDAAPENLKARYEHLIGKISYKAPEQAPECFKTISLYVNHDCPETLTELWQVPLVSILTTMTPDEVVAKCGSDELKQQYAFNS